MQHLNDVQCLIASQKHQLDVLTGECQPPINPPVSVLRNAEFHLLSEIPDEGLGIQKTTDHILETIAPALNNASLSPNYYGFVTGGVTPAARVAENLVTLYDQNVQVHLPDETISTVVEDRALLLLLDLLRFDRNIWSEKTFTTGATSSNVLGLACGREYVINNALTKCRGNSSKSENILFKNVGEHGLLATCRAADVDTIQILTTLPHSSLKKASSILGIGRSDVFDVSKGDDFLAFDLQKTEAMLTRPRTVSVVVVSCGEVNTGAFATRNFEEFQSLRSLCDQYGAWIHVDAGKLKLEYMFID
jgi:glutamate/tyrosine decarboxylase-like PLP-dependent enzyme